MNFIPLVLILILSSCAAHQVALKETASKYKEAKELHKQGHHKEANAIFKQLCEEQNSYAESCEYRDNDESNTTSVVDYFYNETNYLNIQNIVCENIKSKEQCNIEMSNVFYAKLKEAYPYANFDQINVHCKANPEKCYGNPIYVEKVVKESNGKSIAENKRYEEQLRSRENSLMWSQILYGISTQINNQNDADNRLREIQELKKSTTTCTDLGNQTICNSR